MVADIEELETMDASDIYPRRINAKEVLTLQRRGFFFPIADGTAKLSGRDHEFREITPRREQPVGSEDLSGELQCELQGRQPPESKDDAEAQKDVRSIQVDFISLPVPTHQEDHIAGKGYNSMTHYKLAHNFISTPQAMKIPVAKAAVDKE